MQNLCILVDSNTILNLLNETCSVLQLSTPREAPALHLRTNNSLILFLLLMESLYPHPYLSRSSAQSGIVINQIADHL